MDIGIIIHSSEQALKLNRIAEKYPYDILVRGRSGQADAKSTLGIMLLTIEDDVRMVVSDEVDTAELEREIEEFKR